MKGHKRHGCSSLLDREVVIANKKQCTSSQSQLGNEIADAKNPEELQSDFVDKLEKLVGSSAQEVVINFFFISCEFCDFSLLET